MDLEKLDPQLSARIEILHSCGFVQESGRRDLCRIVELLQKHCSQPLTDDVAGTLVTHVAAALKRASEGEQVEPLEPEVLDQVKEIAEYQKALAIRAELVAAMENKLSADEQDFLLVHIGTILETAECK